MSARKYRNEVSTAVGRKTPSFDEKQMQSPRKGYHILELDGGRYYVRIFSTTQTQENEAAEQDNRTKSIHNPLWNNIIPHVYKCLSLRDDNWKKKS